jgi:nitric oxide dioxygenase
MQGVIELEKVEVLLDSQAYLCGPLPFMDLVRSELLARARPVEHAGPRTLLVQVS